MKINTVTIKAPQELSVEIEDIIGAEDTSASGKTLIDRTGTKRILRVRWALLTQAELQAIFTQTAGVFFTIEYPDPELGVTTKTFRATKKESPKSLITRSGNAVWQGVSFEFKEQ